jgi:hypothetical protein
VTDVNPNKEEMIVTEEKRSSNGRRSTDRIDRRKPAEKAENWRAVERRTSERRLEQRRTEPEIR